MKKAVNRPIPTLFLWLILSQAAHSVEEFTFGLYDRLAPARFVAELIGLERSLGFAIANTAIVLLGLICWWAWVRPGHRAARPIAWIWALVEISNFIAHFLLAILAGGYFPGIATAPLLLLFADLLVRQLLRTAHA